MTGDGEDSSPYVGPRPFGAADRDVFFGRDAEVAELASLVIAHPVVLLYAMSGAGKTSLLTAGVVPELLEEGYEVLPLGRLQSPVAPPANARNAFMYAALASLRGQGGRGEADPDVSLTLAEYLASLPRGEDEYGFSRPRLLVFDQFEELFNLYQDRWRQREDFLRQVAQALDEDPSLRVLLSIREDYLAQIDGHASLLPDRLRTRFHLERLRESAALLAVKGPLVARGVEFAPGVAETLIHDLQETRVDLGGGQPSTVVGEFVEPVHLQVVCETLWGRLEPDPRIVAAADLARLGSIDDALIRFYDEAVAAAAARGRVSERRLREAIEESFVTSAATRATVFAAAEETAGLPAAALEELARRHVIKGEWRAGGRWLELAHDRLIEPIQTSNARVRARHRARRRRRLVPAVLLLPIAAALAIVLLSRDGESCCVATPNLVDSDAFEAQKQLRRVGLNLGREEDRVAPEVPVGAIIAQTPRAGSVVRKRTSISIVVAVGEQIVRVPNLLGLTVTVADRRLRSAGLLRGNALGGGSSAPALVRGQIPAAGARVRRGTAVDLFLRRPKLPDLFITTRSIDPDAKGDNMVVVVLVRNRGRGDAGAFTVAAGSRLLKSARRTVHGLSAGKSLVLRLKLPITARARGTSVVASTSVDPDNRVRERREGNNDDPTESRLVPSR